MPVKILLGLILCNAVWATNPILGKFLMQDFSPLHVAWLRYSGALVAYLVYSFVVCIVKKPKSAQKPRDNLRRLSVFPRIILLGIAAFFVSPYFQYIGLASSTAMANSLIVAMEPLFAVLLAWIVIGETIHWRQSIALIVALVGFCFLSNIKPGQLVQSVKLFNVGNIFIMFAVFAEASYSSFVKPLLPVISPVKIFGYALCFGWTIFTLFVWMRIGLPDLRTLNLSHIVPLFLIGPIGTTATYVYWTIALKDISVAAAVVTLFIQPIQGTILGFLLMNERFSYAQSIGAGSILFALFLQTFNWKKTKNAELTTSR